MKTHTNNVTGQALQSLQSFSVTFICYSLSKQRKIFVLCQTLVYCEVQPCSDRSNSSWVKTLALEFPQVVVLVVHQM